MVHFDLKCDNLLCDLRDLLRPVVKIGDLGLSKRKSKQQTFISGNMRGTLPWWVGAHRSSFPALPAAGCAPRPLPAPGHEVLEPGEGQARQRLTVHLLHAGACTAGWRPSCSPRCRA
jgi:hypothetical protein